MHKQSLFATFYYALAVLLQATTDNFPLPFFAFLLNVILAMAWRCLLRCLYRENSKLILSRLFISITHKYTFLILIGCNLIIRMFPQLSDVDVVFMSVDL